MVTIIVIAFARAQAPNGRNSASHHPISLINQSRARNTYELISRFEKNKYDVWVLHTRTHTQALSHDWNLFQHGITKHLNIYLPISKNNAHQTYSFFFL